MSCSGGDGKEGGVSPLFGATKKKGCHRPRPPATEKKKFKEQKEDSQFVAQPRVTKGSESADCREKGRKVKRGGSLCCAKPTIATCLHQREGADCCTATPRGKGWVPAAGRRREKGGKGNVASRKARLRLDEESRRSGKRMMDTWAGGGGGGGGGRCCASSRKHDRALVCNIGGEKGGTPAPSARKFPPS